MVSSVVTFIVCCEYLLRPIYAGKLLDFHFSCKRRKLKTPQVC